MFRINALGALSLTLILAACGGGSDSSGQAPSNQAPSANAGVDQTVNEDSLVNLNGSGADLDGTINSYSWKQLSGTTVTLSNTTSASSSFIAPDIKPDETLIFELTVTDDAGDTAIDTVDIIVTHINQLPQANAGEDQSVAENSIASLNGSGSDNDGTIEGFSWEQLSGSSITLSDTSIANPGFTAPDITSEETLSFRLTVTDDEGATNTDIVEITVEIDDFSSRNTNGFIRSEQRWYDGFGNLEWTYTYILDSVNKIVTRTQSNNNDIRTYYYNDKGELIRRVHIAEGEPNIDGNYPLSSETLYNYTNTGLLLSRHLDRGIDGVIDSTITWEYDDPSTGLMSKRIIESIFDEAAFITTIDYTWADERKISSATLNEGDIEPFNTYFYFEGDNIFPFSYGTEQNANENTGNRIEFTYDNNNNLILQRFYDDTGALTRYVETDYQNTNDVPISNITYFDIYFFY